MSRLIQKSLHTTPLQLLFVAFVVASVCKRSANAIRPFNAILLDVLSIINCPLMSLPKHQLALAEPVEASIVQLPSFTINSLPLTITSHTSLFPNPESVIPSLESRTS